MSARPSVLWSPDWRLASCQRTMRAMRSARGSRPKISSLSSSEPAADPSIDVMSNFITSFSLRRFGEAGDGLGVNAELASHRRVLRHRLLHPPAPPHPPPALPPHPPPPQHPPPY